jgi:hypothetical protein
MKEQSEQREAQGYIVKVKKPESDTTPLCTWGKILRVLSTRHFRLLKEW